jgi:hypothetical protein
MKEDFRNAFYTVRPSGYHAGIFVKKFLLDSSKMLSHAKKIIVLIQVSVSELLRYSKCISLSGTGNSVAP